MKRGTKKQEAHVAAFLKTRVGVLLVHVRRGKEIIWALPTGMIAPNETPPTTLKRVMWEKTGLHVEVEGLYNVSESDVRQRGSLHTHTITTLFKVRKVGGVERETSVRYVPIAELAHTSLDVLTQRLLKDLLK